VHLSVPSCVITLKLWSDCATIYITNDIMQASSFVFDVYIRFGGVASNFAFP
jgi:hypothetical protein